MNDLIKIFIQQNRQAFDSEKPGVHGWKGVEQKLERMQSADSLEQYLISNRALFDSELVPASLWSSIDAQLDKCRHTSGIEQFICENREFMDTEVPDLRVWSEVASALPTAETKLIPFNWQRQLLRVAASIGLLVIGLGAGVWYARNSDGATMAMAEVSTEYAEIEQYYQHDIKDKKAKLATFTGSQSAGVLQDINQLDHIMEELQRELATVPEGNRQQVVRAMIENYKSKAAILERVLGYLGDQPDDGNNSKLNNEIKNM